MYVVRLLCKLDYTDGHSFSPEEGLHTDQEYTVFLPLQLRHCIVVSEHSSNLGELSALKQIFQIQSKTQMHIQRSTVYSMGVPCTNTK